MGLENMSKELILMLLLGLLRKKALYKFKKFILELGKIIKSMESESKIMKDLGNIMGTGRMGRNQEKVS